ncbi:hypothetical protein B0H14DRAFT_3706127 [Mycena olivaceomarginata]|nr:hypothetical protein B0H14DRAFT_3706127 [Mycena olivaceomarginata]
MDAFDAEDEPRRRSPELVGIRRRRLRFPSTPQSVIDADRPVERPAAAAFNESHTSHQAERGSQALPSSRRTARIYRRGRFMRVSRASVVYACEQIHPRQEWLVTTSPLIDLKKLLSEWIGDSERRQLIELALDTNNIRYAERLQADMDSPYLSDGVHQFAQGMAAYRALWAKDATAYSGRSAGVYICLRNTYDSRSPILGWPPGDAPITALLEHLHAYRYYHPAFVSAAVLAALMDAVYTTFQPSQTDAAHGVEALPICARGTQTYAKPPRKRTSSSGVNILRWCTAP